MKNKQIWNFVSKEIRKQIRYKLARRIIDKLTSKKYTNFVKLKKE